MPTPRNVPSPAPSSSSSVTTHHSSLRSQLYNILPKHALFRVKLHIHQLSNVPLLGGQFGVKWRFRNVQSNAGLLAKMKASKSTPIVSEGKGKDKDLSPYGDPMPGYHTYDATEHHGHGIYVNGFRSTESTDYLTAGMHASQEASSSTATSPDAISAAPMGHSYSDGRGTTRWSPLQEHTAQWEHTVTVVTRMDVDRETSGLLSNELKLTIMQRVIPGDPNSPQQPRTGAVHLNLAEYADSGPVTRRHLLRQSKTNATLKLTIELEHIGGEKNYRAPPLQKGEILAQVSGLLSNPGFHPARFLRELEMIEDPGLVHEESYDPRHLASSFDGLASSQGVRATEFLIETLFNPALSSTPSPLTQDALLPADESASFDSSLMEHRSTDSSDTGPSAPSLASGTSGEYSSSTNQYEKIKPSWWWKVSGNRSQVRTPSPSAGVSS